MCDVWLFYSGFLWRGVLVANAVQDLLGALIGRRRLYGRDDIVCARFIKELFPGLCRNVKDTTLSQCLNADPNEGNIKIDIPDKDDPAVFHYDQP